MQVSPTLLNGPASEAVEKSSKRPRSTPAWARPTKAPFNFDALFQTIEEEAFPSIGWESDSSQDRCCYAGYSTSSSSFSDSSDFEDDEEDEFASLQKRKRARSGMLRSVSIMNDLSLLSPTSEEKAKASLMEIRKLDEVLMHRLHRSPLSTNAEHVSVAACAS
jgi:hypothetical protein